MGKLTNDRRWVLSIFARAGYWMSPGDRLSAAKWQAQIARALKLGELEFDDRYELYRITPAGRAALTERAKP